MKHLTFYLCSLYYILSIVEGTVDVNLAELEYLSNHLSDEECYKLFNILHETSYELTTSRQHALYEVGHKKCLEYLLHWNMTPNEGKGETHSVLCHRLRQIGRADLADWLSRTVFENLSDELDKAIISDPFKDLGLDNSTPLIEGQNVSDLVFYYQEPDWDMFDYILVIVAFASIATTIFLIYASWAVHHEDDKNERTIVNQNKVYSRVCEYETESENETSNTVTG